MSATQTFLQALRHAFEQGQLVKCTLSRPGNAAPTDLKNIYLRPVELKGGRKISFNYRFQARDEVKNHSLAEALELLTAMLGHQMLNADLFTTEKDFTLSFGKNGVAQLQEKKATNTAAPEAAHNRAKQRLLDPTASWLHQLGITNAQGVVLAAAQDKWKQINKYLEIIDSLIKNDPLPQAPEIADMGSGKGYLTFALYDFLVNKYQLQPHITGIELRPNLVEHCTRVAAQSGFSGLQFIARDINDYQPERLDMLIALHACDTATDLAIAKGIWEKSRIIVVAPCCHKQIRRDMHTRNEMAPLLRFGILEERQAEIVTDGIRALLLEANGYKTNVFEFISTEHTPKNVMITALQDKKGAAAKAAVLQKVAEVKNGFGIQQHYLEHLLAAKP